MASGDFNGDGCNDLAYAVQLYEPLLPPPECAGFSPCSQLTVVTGACDGSVGTRSDFYSDVHSPILLHAKDLDENSALDLIIGGGGRSSAIFFGDGHGGFILQVPDPPVTAVDRVADFDADGHLDLGNGSRIHFGDGTGSFPRFERYKVLFARAAADFNSDGLLDYVSVTGGTLECPFISGCPGSVWIVLNQGKPPAREVEIDIRPGSDENVINLASYGIIPVAILSSDEFDAPAEVNPETVRLSGAAAKTAGKAQHSLCHATDVNADSLPDLLCQILTQGVDLEPGDTTAVLEAETFTGSSIRGEASVTVRPK